MVSASRVNRNRSTALCTSAGVPTVASGRSRSRASARMRCLSTADAGCTFSAPDTPEVSSRTASPDTVPASHASSTRIECSRRSRPRASTAFACAGARPAWTSSHRRGDANRPAIRHPVPGPVDATT